MKLSKSSINETMRTFAGILLGPRKGNVNEKNTKEDSNPILK